MTSVNNFSSQRFVSAVTLLVMYLCIQSCATDDRSQDEYGARDQRQLDLSNAMLEYNAARLTAELQIIDSLSVAWGWSSEVISGGIVYEKVEASRQHLPSVHVYEGDTVLWDVSVSLINGIQCFSLESLQFVVGSAVQPSGFEAIATKTLRGDSVRAMVPSLMGYGIRGLPGKIPPGALLVLRLRQF